MKTNFLKILSGILTAFILISCSDEKFESKNMEQIYKEEGVPVKVSKIEKGVFTTEYTYNSVLTGVKETNVYASMGSRVEKILVKVGDYVKEDQLLLTFPEDNPKAQYLQAKTACDNAQITYERYQQLYQTGGISKQTLDNIKAKYEVSKANLHNSKEMLKVPAPISGYITKITPRENDNIKEKTHLFTISDTKKLKTKLLIAEDEIETIRKDQKVTAEWKNNLIHGKIVQVDEAMNPMTQAFQAVAEFDNTDKKIMSGTTAKVTIIANGKNESIFIERKNLLKENDKYFVFVLEDNKAAKREVKPGRSFELSVEINSGLNEGDLLITEGQLLLENNTAIKVIN